MSPGTSASSFAIAICFMQARPEGLRCARFDELGGVMELRCGNCDAGTTLFTRPHSCNCSE